MHDKQENILMSQLDCHECDGSGIIEYWSWNGNTLENKDCQVCAGTGQASESEIKQAWDKVDKMKIFEIPVKKDGEKDFILFDIELIKDQFVATHPPLNSDEEKSNKIASVKIEIDECFSLDENLQSLYEDCTDKLLINGFELID